MITGLALTIIEDNATGITKTYGSSSKSICNISSITYFISTIGDAQRTDIIVHWRLI